MWQKVKSAIKNKHFLSLSGNAVMSLLGMITNAIIFRFLDKNSMGEWVFFLSTLLFVDNFRAGFLTTAFIKFYAGESDSRKIEIVGSAWMLGILITFGLLLLSLPSRFFAHSITDGGLNLFFNWFGAAYLCSLPMFISTCVVQGEQQFDRLLYIRICNQGIYITSIITLIILHKLSIHGVLFCYIGASLFTSFFVTVAGWSRIKTIKRSTRAGTAQLYHFGKFSLGTTLSANLSGLTDTYMIKFLLGPASLAVYNLGQSLMQLVEIPLRSFAATGMPELSAAYNQNKPATVIYTMKKYAGMLTVILVPAALLAVGLADVAISLIGGGKYVHTEAANVFRLYMTFALLYPADRFFALTLDVIHRPNVNFYKVLVMAAANLIFDYLGIKVLGNVYGIAITTVVPVLIAVGVGFWALNKYQKFEFIDVYRVGWRETKQLLKTLKTKIRPAKG